MTDLIVAATGHRIDKLMAGRQAFGPPAVIEHELESLARKHLSVLRPTEVISGMALGWDTAVALAALGLGLPLVAAAPFEGQERLWNGRQQARYRDILVAASHVEIVCRHKLTIAFQERNEWMVDRGNYMLALWDGSPGGTANCLDYADRWCVRTNNLWPEWSSRND